MPTKETHHTVVFFVTFYKERRKALQNIVILPKSYHYQQRRISVKSFTSEQVVETIIRNRAIKQINMIYFGRTQVVFCCGFFNGNLHQALSDFLEGLSSHKDEDGLVGISAFEFQDSFQPCSSKRLLRKPSSHGLRGRILPGVNDG